MKRMAVLTILMVIASPPNLMAFDDRRPVGRVLDTIPPRDPPGQQRDKPRHRPGHGRPITVWPGSTTVVREIQPIVIITPPSPQEPPPAPEPEKVWVPPVMDTRTEPGYWDYGIRKVWMGDHWRYEQDFDQPTWVPEKQVDVVKQEGYWKIVEQ